MTPKMILDCDPGHDDAMAILVAHRHAELLGITTVSGNAPLADTTRNALLISQIADIDVDVHAGADRPLLLEPRHAKHVHGENGLDGPDLPELDRQVASNDAVRFIIDTVRAIDDVWLCPVGPMTNIALALREAPDIVDRLAGISFMGGGTDGGNVTATAEFNIWADPHAARVMVTAGVDPLKMVGLNLTRQFLVDDAVAARLHGFGTATGRLAGQIATAYIDAGERIRGTRAAMMHDPCAVLAITHPHLFETTMRHVDVSTRSITAGMTVVDQRDFIGGEEPNVEIVETIDRDAAMKVFVDAVETYP